MLCIIRSVDNGVSRLCRRRRRPYVKPLWAAARDFHDHVRVRYAPSPTGYLHLGGLRTALFNFLFARHTGGKFILRIEDTDKTREVPGSIDAIIKALSWCGVHPDEGPDRGGPFGPYIQSHRLNHYQEHVDRLLESGHAYRCFCSPERLRTLREAQVKRGANSMYDRRCTHLSSAEVEERVGRGEPHVVRLKVPTGTTEIMDLVRGHVSFTHSGIDDQVLLKSDGFPTYHLASVVDDHLMQISHVIRGEEWLSSTPKHAILYKALGFEEPKFVHLPLLLNLDRSKLSKRQGDVNVADYQTKGYLPESLVNFVALLGWNPGVGETQEVFSMEELIEKFSLEAINKAGSVVDMDKLKWFNREHIKRTFESSGEPKRTAAQEELLAKAKLHLNEEIKKRDPSRDLEQFGDDFIYEAIATMKEKVELVDDFGKYCYYFFVPPDLHSGESQQMRSQYWKEETGHHMRKFVEVLKDLNDDSFSSKAITSAAKKLAKALKIPQKDLLMPTRYCITGTPIGAGIASTMEILGKEVSLARIENVLSATQSS